MLRGRSHTHTPAVTLTGQHTTQQRVCRGELWSPQRLAVLLHVMCQCAVWPRCCLGCGAEQRAWACTHTHTFPSWSGATQCQATLQLCGLTPAVPRLAKLTHTYGLGLGLAWPGQLSSLRASPGSFPPFASPSASSLASSVPCRAVPGGAGRGGHSSMACWPLPGWPQY